MPVYSTVHHLKGETLIIIVPRELKAGVSLTKTVQWNKSV